MSNQENPQGIEPRITPPGFCRVKTPFGPILTTEDFATSAGGEFFQERVDGIRNHLAADAAEKAGLRADRRRELEAQRKRAANARKSKLSAVEERSPADRRRLAKRIAAIATDEDGKLRPIAQIERQLRANGIKTSRATVKKLLRPATVT